MKKGFSIIEIILSVAIFSFLASFYIFSIIESYRINERSRNTNIAVILAEEGLEAVRSIRDNNFRDLIIHRQGRSYCLAVENNQWILEGRGPREDCIESVGKFSRQVYITGSGNTRDVSVVISWDLIGETKKNVKLFGRFTDWR